MDEKEFKQERKYTFVKKLKIINTKDLCLLE